jgi:hypothetical protein
MRSLGERTYHSDVPLFVIQVVELLLIHLLRVPTTHLHNLVKVSHAIVKKLILQSLLQVAPTSPVILLAKNFMLGEAYHTVDRGQHALALRVCGRDDCKKWSHLP